MATADQQAPRGSRVVARGPDQESTAAGIYGVIVSAAVMAASHAESSTLLAAGVLVTLIIYWAAERYARVVAERIHEHHRPNARTVWQQLSTGWEMVTASLLPLGVLLLFSAFGARLDVAVLAALICSTVLLCVAGWEIGRHGQLTTTERVVSAAVAGAFGVALVLLKALLH